MSAVDTIRDIPVIVEHRKSCDPDYEPMIIDHDHDYSDSGFPFDNSPRRTRDPLEDIAQRHPELAQHLQGFPRRSQRGAGGAAEHQDPQDDEFLRRRFERPFSGGRFERFGFPFDRDDFDREPQRYYEAYPEHFENFQNQHPQSPTHQQTQHQQQQTHPQQQHSPQYSQPQQQYNQPQQYNQQQQYQQPEYSSQQQAQQEGQQSQTQAPPLYQRRVSQGTQTEEGEVAAQQQTDPGEQEERKEEGGQTRGRPIQQSNTCDLGQSLPDEAVNDREQRSMSLPPENKRFTSSVNIPMGGPQGGQQENGAGGKSQGSSTGSTERVIPIHVEGRDDPIIPKNFSTTSSQPSNPPHPHPQPERIFTDAPRPQPERIFGQRPEHFTQFVNRDHPPHHTRFPSDWHHSFERDFPEDDFGGFRRAGSPGRFGGKQTPSPQPPQHPQPHHKQETASQSQQQPPKAQEPKPAPAEAVPPKPQPQKQPLGPIEQIQAIQKDVSNLIGQVEVFNGQPRDKNYLYLDEMLTRNLLKLDNVDTQGQDAIRQARKEAIKCIEKTISHLEAKAAANAAQKMEVEQPQNEKMDAETSQEPQKEATPTPQEETKMAEGIQQSKSGENVDKAQEASVQTNTEVKNEDSQKQESDSQQQEGEDKATEVKNSEDSTQKETNSGDAKDEKKDKKKTKKKSKEDKETKQ